MVSLLVLVYDLLNLLYFYILILLYAFFYGITSVGTLYYMFIVWLLFNSFIMCIIIIMAFLHHKKINVMNYLKKVYNFLKMWSFLNKFLVNSCIFVYIIFMYDVFFLRSL